MSNVKKDEPEANGKLKRNDYERECPCALPAHRPVSHGG